MMDQPTDIGEISQFSDQHFLQLVSNFGSLHGEKYFNICPMIMMT